MEMVLMSKEDLQCLLLECIGSALQREDSQAGQTIEAPLNVKEVAAFLHLEEPTIYSLVQKRKIPFYRQGKKLYFLRSECLDWIKAGRVDTSSEMAAKAEDGFLGANKKRRIMK